MKTKSLPIMAPVALVLTAGSAFAIESPEDNAMPPQPQGAPAAPQAAPAEQAQGAFLGVISGSVPEALAEHLGLQPGEGVLVGSVVPDGPAAKAGLATHDVITRVDDKAVGDAEALSKAITMHRPGEVVKLARIHKGRADVLDVALGERPAGFQAAAPRQLRDLQLDGVPDEFAQRLRGMIEGNIGAFNFPEGQAAPDLDNALRDMQDRMRQAMDGIDALEVPGQGALDLKSTNSAKLKMVDEGGSVEFESKDGSREVTVRDKEGRIQWSGPWDTEQDKAAPPDDIRHRIDRLNLDSTFKGNGLRFHFNGQELFENE